MAASDDDAADDPENLQRAIETSRDHLTRTLTALERKLSLGRITHDAVDAMRDVVLGPADGSKDMFEIIRRNPIPAAMIGIGVGWLLFSSPPLRRAAAPRHEPADAGLVTRVGTQARAAVDTAQQRAGAAARDNPIILGAVGLAVGALLGTLLPMTRREADLLGGIQAQMTEQAEVLGREALERARAVAEHAGRAAVDAVERDLGVDGPGANGHAKH